MESSQKSIDETLQFRSWVRDPLVEENHHLLQDAPQPRQDGANGRTENDSRPPQYARRERDRAFVHILRSNCVTATDPNLFQAPFRAGIKIDALSDGAVA